MLTKLDAYLLERVFTPIAHWYTRKTGKNQFHLAWMCFGILFVFRCLDAYLSFKNGTGSDLFSILLSGIVIPTYAVMIVSAQNADEKYERTPMMAAPAFLMGFMIWRMLFVFMGVMSVLELAARITLELSGARSISTLQLQIDFVGPIWMNALGSGLYFASVKGPPPMMRREGKKDDVLVPIRA